MGEKLIYQIVLPEVGVVYPGEHNRTCTARCKQCGRPLCVGKGFRLETLRVGRGRTNRGFICLGCLGQELGRTSFWTYCSGAESLRPKNGQAENSFLGIYLAGYLVECGFESMEEMLREDLHIESIA